MATKTALPVEGRRLHRSYLACQAKLDIDTDPDSALQQEADDAWDAWAEWCGDNQFCVTCRKPRTEVESWCLHCEACDPQGYAWDRQNDPEWYAKHESKEK